ncbi:hypothetical protein [Mammaliicoccus sciuri]
MYKNSQRFYVLKIVNGFCCVYSLNNNGYV